MKKDKLQNDDLEQIGRSIFQATRPGIEEIEKIVTAPQLLDSVKARIRVSEPNSPPEKILLLKRSNLLFWNWRTATAGALSILIVCSALIVFQTQNSQPLAEQITPEIQTPAILTNEVRDNKARKIPVVKKRTDFREIADKAKISTETDRVKKTNALKPSKSIPKPSPEIFYSLTAGGNPENISEDLQVVRTELSKSDLFALGINLPLENEKIKIKTDLLIGEDGVARAIRFVGKF